MEFDHRTRLTQTRNASTTDSTLAPGKRTLTEQLPVQRREGATPPGAESDTNALVPSTPSPLPAAASPRPTLQMLFGFRLAPAEDPVQVHAAAAHGTATPASKLPYTDQIQRAFGRHDISGIQAHVGSDAAASAREMGAQAFATGDHVVLGDGADLHTVAHEAAHVIQQRGGVQLKGGVGEVGDAYEQNADAVADRVVQGESAEELLDEHAGGSAAIASERPVQQLSGSDYPNPTHQNNVRDAIVQAMRANLGGMDWNQYWNHIIQHNHNTQAPVDNSSTFGGDTQHNILGYIQHVLNTYTPYFNNDRLVFDSTAGGICNGLHQHGPRTNVRVIVVVAELEDDVPMGNQVSSMVVENAYPIP